MHVKHHEYTYKQLSPLFFFYSYTVGRSAYVWIGGERVSSLPPRRVFFSARRFITNDNYKVTNRGNLCTKQSNVLECDFSRLSIEVFR